MFYLLSTSKIIEIFSKITGIEDLEYNPYLHGAGLHAHPRYGRLNMHLDYEKHIILKNKQRRLNIILFLSKDWKNEWNGDNQLWNSEMKKCVVKTYPKFNSAIIFKTDEITWHGLPEKIMCPEGVFRKSLAYYYTQNYSDALAETDKAIAIFPDLAIAYARKGSIYYRLGDTQRATVNWNIALTLDPEYEEVRSVLLNLKIESCILGRTLPITIV